MMKALGLLLLTGLAVPASAASLSTLGGQLWSAGGGLATTTGTAPPPGPGVQATRAGDFTKSMAINTHIIFSDSAYADTTQVLADLNYIGIHTVRDQIPPTNPAFWTVYYTLMSGGIKFNLQNPDDQIDIAGNVATVASMATAHPGYVNSIEGLNEIDGRGTGFTYGGFAGAPAAAAYQTDLWNAVQANSTTRPIPVYVQSLLQGGDAYRATLPNQNAVSTYGNAHVYFLSVPPIWNLPNQLEADNANTPGKQMVLTETGYVSQATSDCTGCYVNEAVQAKFILSLYFDSYQLGTATTYIYQLLDEYLDPGNSNHDIHFGVMHYDHSPKPSGTALHNLTTILSDGGSQTFFPGKLNYTLTNFSGLENGSSLVLQKSNGAYDIVVWAEPQLWNATTHTPITITPTTVGVALGATFSSVKVYDPYTSSTAISSTTNASSVSVSVGDRPIIIEVQ